MNNEELDRTIATLITEARAYVILHNETLYSALTFHPGSDEFDEAFDAAMIDRLFERVDEALKSVVLAYVTLSRAVNLGTNTDLSTLNPEQCQRHEQVLSSCENSFVQVRAAYEALKGELTSFEQQVVERLVEVKFNRGNTSGS